MHLHFDPSISFKTFISKIHQQKHEKTYTGTKKGKEKTRQFMTGLYKMAKKMEIIQMSIFEGGQTN